MLTAQRRGSPSSPAHAHMRARPRARALMLCPHDGSHGQACRRSADTSGSVRSATASHIRGPAHACAPRPGRALFSAQARRPPPGAAGGSARRRGGGTAPRRSRRSRGAPGTRGPSPPPPGRGAARASGAARRRARAPKPCQRAYTPVPAGPYSHDSTHPSPCETPELS